MADQHNAEPEIVEQQETLTELFEQTRLHDAMEKMRDWDSIKLHTELSLAFASIPHAPSSFLQCVNLYSQLPDKKIAFVLPWIETAVTCIKLCKEPQITLADSLLAGSMLPALIRSRIPLVADFALAYCVDNETLVASCTLLINIRVRLAVHFMDCLKRKDLLPIDTILEAVIKEKDFHIGDMFVEGHKEYQEKFVQMLINGNVHDKVIKKRLSLFKLKASAFPVYLERRQKATLRFLIYSKEYEQALQFVESSENLKVYACNMILQHAGVEDAATKHFIFRAGLKDIFPEVNTSGEDEKSFKNQGDLPPVETCLSLVDAIGEASIVFVDTLTALQACVDYLIKQPAVGFDTEWKAVHIAVTTDDDAAKCALLQLASREKAFVVDVVALHEHGSILAPLFQSNSVIKLGFDTRGDVKALRPFLTGGNTTNNVMSMLLDLQAVTRKLAHSNEATGVKPEDGYDKNRSARILAVNSEAPTTKERSRKWKHKRSKIRENEVGVKTCRLGLATIAKLYLGRPLDKRARMSDWERRPLTPAQLHYAALDAHVLVQIYDKMQETHSIDVFDTVLKRCTQKYIR